MTTLAQKVLDLRVAGRQFEIPDHPRLGPFTVGHFLMEHPARLYSVKPDAPLVEALRLMAEHDIGAVLVVDGNRLNGIFSERDHARHSAKIGQSVANVPVRDVMSSCDVFVKPADSVQMCVALMRERRLRHLPVQEGGNLIAMVSLDDLLTETVAHHERVFKEIELDEQLLFLPGTYSC